MTAKSEPASEAAGREIVMTRIFDAPRDLVFEAWTDPRHVAQWWGPKGFTSTIDEMDVRPGGVWRLVLHGPDGVDYRNKIVFVEIVKPERLVYSHVSSPRFEMTVNFAEEGGKTRLTARMVFESAALRAKVAQKFGAVEGLYETLERLAEHLAKRG
ncbi:MAG: SRPBCC family protein [Acidobacteriota bacterium]|nr:SRPBCC family protein [Acidobacteriota bacterium]